MQFMHNATSHKPVAFNNLDVIKLTCSFRGRMLKDYSGDKQGVEVKFKMQTVGTFKQKLCSLV